MPGVEGKPGTRKAESLTHHAPRCRGWYCAPIMRGPLFLCVAALACACGPGITGEVFHHTLTSEAVGDTYDVLVRVPAAYAAEPGRRFPVILQLDGKVPGLDEFDTTARLASALEAAGELNPVVVIGVSALEGQHRLRDYTPPPELPDLTGAAGGAPAFLTFTRTELLPFLEREYRVGDRALFGHSLGGLFGVYLFTTDAPPLVSAVVAASPSLVFDGGSIHGALARADATRSFPRLLVLTAGRLEGPEMMVPVQVFADQVRARELPGVEVIHQTFPVDHLGSIEPSFREGLRALHAAGWDTP